jgi:hypothetical protein
VNVSISLTPNRHGDAMAEKAKRKSTLRAASLATGSPELGVPTLTQHHVLQAASLEVSAPEIKPAAKRAHHLESGDGTPPKNRGGRPPKLTATRKADLQSMLEEWWPRNPRRTQDDAIAQVKKFFVASRQTIEREIVRPVYKKLFRQK